MSISPFLVAAVILIIAGGTIYHMIKNDYDDLNKKYPEETHGYDVSAEKAKALKALKLKSAFIILGGGAFIILILFKLFQNAN